MKNRLYLAFVLTFVLACQVPQLGLGAPSPAPPVTSIAPVVNTAQSSPTRTPSAPASPETPLPTLDFTEATYTPLVTMPPTVPPGCYPYGAWMEDSISGNFLHICTLDGEYLVGPLESGAMAVGPNRLFLVYVTFSGNVYALRLGETIMRRIGDIKYFSAIQRGDTPKLEVIIHGNHPYIVEIKERNWGQSTTFPIPRTITAPY